MYDPAAVVVASAYGAIAPLPIELQPILNHDVVLHVEIEILLHVEINKI